MELHSLQPDSIISNQSYEIIKEDLDKYLAVVGMSAVEGPVKAKVPSIAIAAWALGASMKDIDLPAGAVHVSHQITSLRPVSVGSKLNYLSRIVQNDLRRGVRFLKIQTDVTHRELLVLTEIATITIKEDG